MKDRLIELMKFAKSIDSERLELQKDEYLFLLEFIEKLENENLILKQKRLTLWDRLEFVRMAREKAIKEFSERLKEEVVPNIDDTYIEPYVEEQIDQIAKELTEENK